MRDRTGRVHAEGSWEWLEFAARLPAKAEPASQAGVSGLIYSGRCIYRGLTGTNTSTGGGSLQVKDGVDGTGLLIQYIGVGASSSLGNLWIYPGVLCEIGVYITNSGITTTASAWIVPLSLLELTPPGQ